MSKVKALFLSLFSLMLLSNVSANLDLAKSELHEFVNALSSEALREGGNDTDTKLSLLSDFDFLLNDVVEELQKEENADIRDEFLKTLSPVSNVKSFKDHHSRKLKYSVEKFNKHFDEVSDDDITRGLSEKPELFEKIKKLNLYLYEILLDGKKLNTTSLDKLLDFIYHRPAFFAKNHKKLTITASIAVVIVLAIVVCYGVNKICNKSGSSIMKDDDGDDEGDEITPVPLLPVDTDSSDFVPGDEPEKREEITPVDENEKKEPSILEEPEYENTSVDEKEGQEVIESQEPEIAPVSEEEKTELNNEKNEIEVETVVKEKEIIFVDTSETEKSEIKVERPVNLNTLGRNAENDLNKLIGAGDPSILETDEELRSQDGTKEREDGGITPATEEQPEAPSLLGRPIDGFKGEENQAEKDDDQKELQELVEREKKREEKENAVNEEKPVVNDDKKEHAINRLEADTASAELKGYEDKQKQEEAAKMDSEETDKQEITPVENGKEKEDLDKLAEELKNDPPENKEPVEEKQDTTTTEEKEDFNESQKRLKEFEDKKIADEDNFGLDNLFNEENEDEKKKPE